MPPTGNRKQQSSKGKARSKKTKKSKASIAIEKRWANRIANVVQTSDNSEETSEPEISNRPTCVLPLPDVDVRPSTSTLDSGKEVG